MKKMLSLILALAMLLSMTSAMAEEVAFEQTINWDAEYDVVVAGFGAAGGVSAITAADAGAKVLLLEKAPEGEAGGNSRYAAQIILTPTDREGAITYFKAMRGGYDNQSDEVIELIVDGAMAIPQWLVEMGADESKFLNYPLIEYPELPGAEAINTTEIDGEFWTSKFWSLIFSNVTKRENIDVWYSAPAVHLIQDPATKIIHGVQVEQNGQTLNVRAKNGVVMAVGGFENNEDMIENYTQMPECYSKAARFNTGDGVKMAIEVGADLWHMSTLSGPDINFVNPETKLAPGYNAICASEGLNMFTGFAQDALMVVGGDGTRFIDETTAPSHGHVNNHGTWVSQQIPNNSWAVWDSTNTRSAYLSFSEGNKEEIEKGWIITADTLEELAEKMNVPVMNFLMTVQRYNGFCEAGFDADFGVSTATPEVAADGTISVAPIGGHPEYLKPIAVGPFYAMPLKPTFTNTQGGARRNTECEVLDVAGNPIPHLYSAGEFGSFYCDIYNGGGNLAECVFSGRIAGANAATAKTDVTVDSLLTKEAYDGRSTDNFETADNEKIGSAIGMGGEVVVKVTMDGDKIAAVEVIKHGETPGIGDKAIDAIPGAIVEAQSADVDTVTGATITSNAIINAVKTAMAE